VAECPYEFYRNWVLNAAKTQAAVEGFTRPAVGTAECPIAGLPVAAGVGGGRGGPSEVI
jgi:amidase